MIALSIMFILLSFCLCGCASVNFVTYHNDDGSIYEYVYLNLDKQAIIDHGYDFESVKFEIETNSHMEASDLIVKYQNKITRQYQNQHISSGEYTILYNGIQIIKQNWDDGKYVIGLKFNNSSIYKTYYELMNGATFNSNTKQVKKLFYTKSYYYGTTNYGDYSIFNRIYNYYANTIFSTISPQETTLNYSYSVSSRRFHSDADNTYVDNNGNYIHVWRVDPNEPAREIYFYTISANRSVWIITCLIVGLVVSVILCIAGLIILRINKYKVDDD